MNYRCYERLAFLNSIDDAVAIGKQLANILVIKFRDFASRTREMSVFVRPRIVRTTTAA